MKQKRFVSYYSHTQIIGFTKDGVLIPLYLSKLLNMPSTFYYGYNIGEPPMPKEHRGMRFVQLHLKVPTPFQQFIDMLSHIILPARSIGGVFMIHKSRQVMLTTILYKLINPKGKVMVMSDWKLQDVEYTFNTNSYKKQNILHQRYRKWVNNLFFKKCDVFSVESKQVYEACVPLFQQNKYKCLTHCFPCIDDILFNEYQIKRKNFQEKENIILHVGRIGDYIKNTDMILDAAKLINFSDWKMVLIGPITDSFITKKESDYKQKIELFFKENPNLVNKVIFTGPIYDFKKLFEYYNNSKIFLLTSRSEGFGNVLSQAAALGCYIVSTDVGGASLVSNNWTFGCKVPQNDAKALANILNKIIQGQHTINPQNKKSFQDLSYSKLIYDRILPKMM